VIYIQLSILILYKHYNELISHIIILDFNWYVPAAINLLSPDTVITFISGDIDYGSY